MATSTTLKVALREFLSRRGEQPEPTAHPGFQCEARGADQKAVTALSVANIGRHRHR